MTILGYKLYVRHKQNWMGYNHARLQISVGGERHEGQKFETTMYWLKERFQKVSICVNDTLQRYNIEILNNVVPEQAYRQSKNDGDKWINRNEKYLMILENAGIDMKLYRWDDWRNKRIFPEYKKKIENLYANHEGFKSTIDEQVNIFWERRHNDFGQDKESLFKENAKLYLMEECAIFSLMYKTDTAVDIYPGDFLLPFIRFKNANIVGLPDGFRNWEFTSIGFRKKPVLQVK